MFKHFGQFIIKFRILIIGFWILLVAASWFLAPSLSSNSTGGDDIFLPSDSESKQAAALYDQYFAHDDSLSVSTLTILFFNSQQLSEENMTKAQQLQDWLLSDQAPPTVLYVQSIFVNPELTGRLLSPDGTTMLLNIGLDNSTQENLDQALQQIRTYRDANLNDGTLEVLTSGLVAIDYDMHKTLTESIDVTTYMTIVLVVVLLLLIYRSPLAILMPLLTIGCAYIVSRGALGLLGQYINIWSQLDVLVIVLVFGVGTDYCLFMISRYREELSKTADALTALKNMISRIGIVISASALAVFVGLAVMGVAQFQMLQTAGPSMSISIIITLLAAITLAPAVMSYFKRGLFWPTKIKVKDEDQRVYAQHKGGFWGWIGTLATKYNIWVILIIGAFLFTPVGVLYPHVKVSYNSLEQLPKESEAGRSFNILATHFNIAEVLPSYVVIANQSDFSLTSPSALKQLQQLATRLENVNGISTVQSLFSPNSATETSSIMHVSTQLLVWSSVLQQSTESDHLLNALIATGYYLDELQATFAHIDLSEQQQKVNSVLSFIQTADDQLCSALESLLFSLQEAATAFMQNDNPLFLSQTLRQTNPSYAALLSAFVSPDGQAMQFYILVTDHPFSQDAMEAIRQARVVIQNFTEENSDLITDAAIGGNTPSQVDIQDAMNRDVVYIQVVMVCCLFVILAVLLRSLLAPIYLLATVLLSYFTTMGLCSWIFVDLLGHDGIGFFMPVIVFVLLVALGSDYNIFLMSRIKEEAEVHLIKPSVRGAVAMTGGIISACGLILGGTFAALAISPILMLFQIGVAVAIGVFLDTFIIRPLLVPAITSLIGRYTWWPFGHKKIEEKEESNLG